MAYFKRRKKGESKTISLNAEVQQSIEEQLRRFREKFGREAGPEDPLFFDPDADTLSRSLRRSTVEMLNQILSSASRAGIRPELIYAMKKTEQDGHESKSAFADRSGTAGMAGCHRRILRPG